MAQRGLEAIYREHCRMVYWAAYGITRSDSDARDVSQTVFLRALKHMNGLSSMTDSQLRGWLYRVAVNLCRDLMRRRKRETLMEELPEVPGGRVYELPEESAVTEEQRRMVRSAIDGLPEIYRTAVTLHYFSGLSYREIAELGGTAEGTVKARISRAKERLYRLLKEGGKND